MATFKGKITAVLPEKSGTSKSGNPWRKREAVIEYGSGQFPQSIIFEMFNDEIERLDIKEGLEYEVELEFRARKWGDRYFLSVTCRKATLLQQPVEQQPVEQPAPQPEETDGFPF